VLSVRTLRPTDQNASKILPDSSMAPAQLRPNSNAKQVVGHR
jgi:hypothetical protein